MQLGRRDFLRLTGIIAASVAVSGCMSPYQRIAQRGTVYGDAPPLAPRDYAGLTRLTYGPHATERQRVAEIGLAGWIEEQFAPASLDDGAAEWRTRRFETLHLPAADLRAWRREQVMPELQTATVLRQIYSRRQVYERIVEFWGDHFNISLDKGECWWLKTVDEREVIRAHALGSFRDMLWASAHSPAMLTYLDNQTNHKDAPNENYARELLELHTLGVNGGYTQQDVMELARCLTGWSVATNFYKGGFIFNADQHDDGPKKVLGWPIAPKGQAEAEEIIERLAVHPTTTRFLARKAVRRFIGEGADAALTERAAQAFLQSNGDIPAMMRVILLDGVANPAVPLPPKIKRPLHFITSALRQLQAESDGRALVDNYLMVLGQAPFMWPMPDGYPDEDAAWMYNLQPRWNFALTLALNEVNNTTWEPTTMLSSLPNLTPAAIFDQMSQILLGTPLPETTRDTLVKEIGITAEDDNNDIARIVAAGLIAGPAFQWH